MFVIHKRLLELQGLLGEIQTLYLPEDASVLTAQWQPNNGTTGISLWYQCETHIAQLEARKFVIFGTGHSMPDELNLRYISTTQMSDFVWHIFEVIA